MPKHFLVPLIFMLALLPIVAVWAKDIPTATTSITKDDLIAHPVGREVKDLNDRMRELGQNADNYEKGSDSYVLLKEGFEKRKKERDKVGEDIRGLRDFEVVLYGDKAVGDAAAVKQAVINFYIRHPSQRHIQPLHAYFDKNGRGPLVSTTRPNAEDLVVKKEQATSPATPYYGEPIVVTPVSPPNPDNCVCVLGQCSPGC